MRHTESSKKNFIEWVSFPVKEEKRKGILALVFIIVFSVLLGYAWGSLWGCISFAFLFISLLPFYIPTYYRLDEEKIILRRFYTVEKRWDEIRSYYPDRYGVLLSPFSYPTRLENFRGIYLRFSGNREEVLSFIEKIFQAKKEPESERTSEIENRT